MVARVVQLLTTAVLIAAVVAGCGNTQSTAGGSGRAVQPASLVLDFTPNAIHSGIYLAIARHYDTEHGVKLDVQVPGASTDAPDLLSEGRVDFAILDIHDLAIADAQGRNLVGVMAIVERPLAAVIAQKRFRTPAALQGQTVGVTGDPSDLAVLRSEVAGSGGDPNKVKTITIGYNAVPDLADGRVAAATSFWNDEGVQLQHADPGQFNVFRVERYGAPPYPELVLSTTRAQIREHPALVRGVVQALVAGYEGVLKDPAAGIRALDSQVDGLSPAAVRRQLRAELPAFVPAVAGTRTPATPGALVPRILGRWASWEQRFGIVRRVPDISRMFDRAFLKK